MKMDLSEAAVVSIQDLLLSLCCGAGKVELTLDVRILGLKCTLEGMHLLQGDVSTLFRKSLLNASRTRRYSPQKVPALSKEVIKDCLSVDRTYSPLACS